MKRKIGREDVVGDGSLARDVSATLTHSVSRCLPMRSFPDKADVDEPVRASAACTGLDLRLAPELDEGIVPSNGVGANSSCSPSG